jgi:hypothetical protein
MRAKTRTGAGAAEQQAAKQVIQQAAKKAAEEAAKQAAKKLAERMTQTAQQIISKKKKCWHHEGIPVSVPEKNLQGDTGTCPEGGQGRTYSEEAARWQEIQQGYEGCI